MLIEKSLSLEFKMDLGLEMAAKMFLHTGRNLQKNVFLYIIFLLIYEYSQKWPPLAAKFLALEIWEVGYMGVIQSDKYS